MQHKCTVLEPIQSVHVVTNNVAGHVSIVKIWEIHECVGIAPYDLKAKPARV